MSQIIFLILLSIAGYLLIKKAKTIWDNIQLGRKVDRSDQPKERWKQVFFIALGQKKMFKKPIPAVLHIMVYVSFLIVNLELLEIVLDGIFGTHRLFQPYLGSLYPILLNSFEFLAVLVIVSCAAFLYRRNVSKVKRFHKEEMSKWPTLDANLILIFEIVLMFFLLSMNATDSLIVKKDVAMAIKEGRVGQSFFFSDLLIPLYSGLSLNALHIIERVFWWAHICGIFFFANYVLYSKHLHIFLAFPNTYYANLNEEGKFENMASVTKEVKLMLGMPVEVGETTEATEPPARFGAKDVNDLNKINLLNAYSCTECGRCTAACPANITGKKLSPRKIMMDTRDRLEEYSNGIKKNGADHVDGKSLLGDYISEEEIFACTTCNACVEACPINIDPLNIIMQLRQYKVMEEAQGPAEWNMVYQNMETSFSPWKFPPTDRFKWKSMLNPKKD